jgi:hypothetical protein
MAPEPDDVEFPGPPVIAEADAAEAIVDDDAAPAAATYALRKRQSKKTQVTLAVAMLLAVIVLAGVLVWVIRYNSTAEPTVSQVEIPTHESERT